MHLHTIEAKNFSCLRDVKLDLTPLHALIGPNDSGKSTLLRAVRMLTQYLALAVQEGTGGPTIDTQGLDLAAGPRLLGQFGYLSLEVEMTSGPGPKVRVQYKGLAAEEFPALLGDSAFKGALCRTQTMKAVQAHPDLRDRAKAPASLLRFDPDELRKQSDLIPEKELVTFHERSNQGMRGDRLPGIYDTIMNRGDDAFAAIARKTRELFPTVRNVRLRTVSNSQKCLEVELVDGTRVPAAQMSEGLLYFLAYAALPYLAPSSILLVEEPENGLHPARIRDVMNILKEISKTTQVLIATHSPLVVNELEADQVTVVTRDTQRGTEVHCLNSTTDFEARSKVYLPGELWLNYANGVNEVELLGPTRAAK